MAIEGHTCSIKSGITYQILIHDLNLEVIRKEIAETRKKRKDSTGVRFIHIKGVSRGVQWFSANVPCQFSCVRTTNDKQRGVSWQ